MKHSSIPGTITEAKRCKLKVRTQTTKKPDGIYVDGAPREGICYIGPCEDGVRPVCYFTDTGCDFCVDYPDPACTVARSFPTDDGKILPKRKPRTKDVVEVQIPVKGWAFDTKSYERRFEKPIRAFAGVRAEGFLGTANASGQGTKDLLVIVDFAGFGGTWYEKGKVFVRILF